MSIYGTWLSIDDDHARNCAMWVEDAPGSGCYELVGTECTCGLKAAPIVYEGSHILPSDDDVRGGWIDVAAIPDHISRDGRDDAPEGAKKPWLRLSVGSRPSALLREGKPYVPGGSAVVVLDRAAVERLSKTLTAWLEDQGA